MPEHRCPPRDLFDALCQLNETEAAIERLRDEHGKLTQQRESLVAIVKPAMRKLGTMKAVPVDRKTSYALLDNDGPYRIETISGLNVPVVTIDREGHAYDPDESGLCRCSECADFIEAEANSHAAHVPDRNGDYIA